MNTPVKGAKSKEMKKKKKKKKYCNASRGPIKIEKDIFNRKKGSYRVLSVLWLSVEIGRNECLQYRFQNFNFHLKCQNNCVNISFSDKTDKSQSIKFRNASIMTNNYSKWFCTGRPTWPLSMLGKTCCRRYIAILFLIFPRKKDLKFHENCLRQFAWNVKSYFLGKIGKI